tara:strand:- start:65 stop:1108 length:1044 start_codon:yes stop_codon:yes gene_type:complete
MDEIDESMRRFTYKSVGPCWQVPEGLHVLAKTYTDVVVVARGREFPAHVVILACACGYFNSALSSGLTQEGRLTLDADPDYVQAVLDFAYRGECTVDDANELFELAHFLQFEGLLSAVARLHEAEGGLRFVPQDARFRLLTNAIRFAFVDLERMIIRELGHNMMNIFMVHFDAVASLDEDTLVKWLWDDDVACPEEWVLELATAWLRKHPGVESTVEERVLSTVRFENIGKRKRDSVRENEYVVKYPMLVMNALWGKLHDRVSRPRGGIALDDTTSFQVGTRVEVIDDLDYVKTRCKNGVGWCEPMKEMLGKTFEIRKILKTKGDGVPRVEFAQYKLPVSCLLPAEA